MVIPKPFSTVLLLAGSPIEVPQNLSRQEISEVTEQIQREMDRLHLIGQRLIRGDQTVRELAGQLGRYPDDAVKAAELPGSKTDEEYRRVA